MVIFIISISLFFSVLLIWKIPFLQLKDRGKRLPPKDYIYAENEYRKTIAQIVGGLYVLAGLGFTWTQLSATQNTLILAQERLITDRYSKAIDQLGGDRSQTRLGGVYALGKIASGSGGYVSIVDNVLASYIRLHSSDTAPELQEEIQASINIITSPKIHNQAALYDSNTLNLSQAQLKGFQFNYAILNGATLNQTNFSECSFIGANLNSVTAVGADFSSANLYKMISENSDFSHASFRSAVLTQSNFSHSNLSLCSFIESDLREADLSGVNGSGANLSGANLSGANLSGAILSGADFRNALLDGANLKGTDLTKVSNISRTQLEKTITDNKTKIPTWNH